MSTINPGVVYTTKLISQFQGNVVMFWKLRTRAFLGNLGLKIAGHCDYPNHVNSVDT